MKDPFDVFKRAVFWVSSLSSRIFANKPGAVIERMSPEEREALSQLKSSELEKDRMTEFDMLTVAGNQYYVDKEFEKAKLEFDKKILK